MKKLIAFDLDDTLSVTKSPMDPKMADLLARLLKEYEVCVISGGRIEQFKAQVLDLLDVDEQLLPRLHLMPTCGTRYYRYDVDSSEWKLQYANDMSEEQKQKVTKVLEEEARALDLWCDTPAGEIIEDRHSQVTMTALGQQASPEDKYAWAEKYKDIRPVLRDNVAKRVPELEVRIGGTTSTDVTLKGIDKAYGMQKLIDETAMSKDDILFIGDKLEPGGNDYPVKAMGIDCIAVEHWQDTAREIEDILA